MFTGRVFQDENGTIFVLPSGGDVSQQLAWLEKYADIANVKSGVIKSNEYTPLGQGKVVIVGKQAVYVYRDAQLVVTTAPKMVRSDSSQSISKKQLEQFGIRFPKIWWSEAWGTVVVSDENDILISHIYNEGTNTWTTVSPLEPKAQLKTSEQILTEWRQKIEAPGNIVGYTPQEKKKLLQYFDALKYVTPKKNEQIENIFPWFHAPFSPDFPLRFLENAKRIINNPGKGIWSGVGDEPGAVKLDILFGMGQLPGESRSDFIRRANMNEVQWYKQIAGVMKEAMSNEWMTEYSPSFNKDSHYADVASMTMYVVVLRDLLNAEKADGSRLISNNHTRNEIEQIVNIYQRQFNDEAKRRGW